MSDLNDPRVLFAAERTLLAWSRTSLTLMAFGFVVERFGLFVKMLAPQHAGTADASVSFWVGVAFILLGTLLSVLSALQYRKVVATLGPAEVPERYWVNLATFTSLALAVLGVALTAYLFRGFRP
jgi:putative membrane protein